MARRQRQQHFTALRRNINTTATGTTTTTGSNNAMSLQDIVPHLRSTIFLTGAFCTAWAWDLVFYGASHAAFDENPLQDQLSFGGNQHAPKYISVLLLQYLVVCGGAAVLSDYFGRQQQQQQQQQDQNKSWSQAAIVAVEFVPSPVFAGKLMAYLSQFAKLRTMERAIINLAATLFAAVVAHTIPWLFASNDNNNNSNSNNNNTNATTSSTEQQTTAAAAGGGILEQYRLQRFPIIVQNTLGFGLGIAWNVFLGQFAPAEQRSSSKSNSNDLDLFHLVALISYLLVVSLIAFRLAATAKEMPETLQERLMALGAFAMYVVVAFTLVVVLNALLAPGWIGAIESLIILLFLSAAMSAMVATVNFDDISEQVHETLEHGPVGIMFRILVCVPCVWCCCPWILVLWLLAGATENIGVKEHWFKLIAMTAGLAASIEASGMLTEATDALAGALDICNAKYCRHKWLFVILQTLLAVLTTVILIPSIAPLSDAVQEPSTESTGRRDEETATQREDQPLLGRFRRKK